MISARFQDILTPSVAGSITKLISDHIERHIVHGVTGILSRNRLPLQLASHSEPPK